MHSQIASVVEEGEEASEERTDSGEADVTDEGEDDEKTLEEIIDAYSN